MYTHMNIYTYIHVHLLKYIHIYEVEANIQSMPRYERVWVMYIYIHVYTCIHMHLLPYIYIHEREANIQSMQGYHRVLVNTNTHTRANIRDFLQIRRYADTGVFYQTHRHTNIMCNNTHILAYLFAGCTWRIFSANMYSNEFLRIYERVVFISTRNDWLTRFGEHGRTYTYIYISIDSTHSECQRV